MAVIINGTSGITNVNGSASTPAETGLTTNTGIYYGTNTVGLATNGTSALFIDASQNVGIGTSSPTSKLVVSGGSLATSGIAFNVASGLTTGKAGTYDAGTLSAIHSYSDNASMEMSAGTSANYVSAISCTGTAATNYSGTIRFTTYSAERMRIDSSGNVGIGQSSITQAFANYTQLNISGSSGATIQMQSGTTNRTNIVADNNGLYIASLTGYTVFSTGGTGTGTERMRIDSSGNLLVGANSFSNTQMISVNGGVFSQAGGFQSWAGGYNGYNSTNNYFGVQFFKAATSSLAGNVRQGVLEMQFDNFLQLKTDAALPIRVIAGASNGVQLASGGTSWTSLSDERYKTDLKSIENASVKVSSLRAVTGRFLTDEESKSRSFLIAQDVQSVFPEAVDATNPEQLGLSYTDVIPLLVAAIKEQQTIITQLQADIATLKGQA